MKWEDPTWYNRRGLTNFYTVAIEPRLEFAATGRQTPKEVSLGYRRGLTNFYTVAIEPRLEFAAKGRQTLKEVSLGYRRGLTVFYNRGNNRFE